MKEKISITMDGELLAGLDRLVDHIYIKNRSHAVEYLVRKSLGGSKSAVILAGGSPEMLRISKAEFRPTARINGAPLIELQLRRLAENNFSSVYIIGRKEILSAVFDCIGSGEQFGLKVIFVEEHESRGTAESLRLLRGKINGPFLVVFCDILFDKININELWESHIKHSYVATLILTTSPTPCRKGIVKLEGTKILDFTQKPKHADVYIGFSSIFVAEPKIFDFEGASLEEYVFPKLARQGLLGGHVSSEKEVHIHTKEDIKRGDF